MVLGRCRSKRSLGIGVIRGLAGFGLQGEMNQSLVTGMLPKDKSGKNSAHSINRAYENPGNFIGFNVAVPEDGHAPGLGQHALTSSASELCFFWSGGGIGA